MSTAPTAVEPKDDDIEREILDDPAVQKALAELDDPEDREDLIDALVIQKRIDEGKEQTIPWEEVQRKLGL
jgi:hypothetical protein